MRRLMIALLALLWLAQPGTALAQNGFDYFASLPSKGAKVFWAKSFADDGPNDPVLAPVTGVIWEGCQLVLRFDDKGAPYSTPVFVKMGSVKSVAPYGSYFEIEHSIDNFMGNYRWGIAVPGAEIDNFKAAFQSVLDQCGGG